MEDKDKAIILSLRKYYGNKLSAYLDEEIMEAYRLFPGTTYYTDKDIVDWMIKSPLERIRERNA